MTAEAASPEYSNARVAGRFLRFGGSFWRGASARRAWLLSLGLFGASLALVGFVLLINRWMAVFFDAIERRDAPAIWAGLAQIALLGAAAAASNGLATWLRQTLQIAWREFLTRRLLGMWLDLGSSHHVEAWGRDVDLPEFRIAEDVRMSVDSLVDFAASLLNSFITAAAFITVLWNVGGAITLPAGGIVIPGYLVWLAILYAIVMSTGVGMLGRPLVHASERKNAAEASFRSDMVELGQIPVEVSLRHGDDTERARVLRDVERLFARWRQIVVYQSRVAVLVNANITFMPIVPLLATSPKYLAAEMTLGAIMQCSAAFIQAQYAFNWFFDNYLRIADWLANTVRVVRLLDALEAGAGGTEISPVSHDAGDGVGRAV